MVKYNLFEMAAHIASEAPVSGVSRPVFLRPERRSRFSNLIHKVADLIRS